MAKKNLDAPGVKNKDFDAPSVSQVKDPYEHRSNRIKYVRGYGAEGAARGVTEIPTGEPSEFPEKNKVDKEADKKNAEQIKSNSKTKPNPY